jgi:PLAT/LH2 domain
VEEFQLKLQRVGRLQQLTLRSDGIGCHPAWHCDTVVVAGRTDDQTTYFLCNR